MLLLTGKRKEATWLEYGEIKANANKRCPIDYLKNSVERKNCERTKGKSNRTKTWKICQTRRKKRWQLSTLLVHTVYNSTLTYPQIPLKTPIRDGWRYHGVIVGLVLGVVVPCCWLFIYGLLLETPKIRDTMDLLCHFQYTLRQPSRFWCSNRRMAPIASLGIFIGLF